MMPPRFKLRCHYSVTDVANHCFTPLQIDSKIFTADDMTCDITLKKVFQRHLSPCARHGRRLSFSLYILFIYICHIMSLRQQALLSGLSWVTLKIKRLSFVIIMPPKVEQASRLSSLMPTCPTQAPSFSFQISNTGAFL